MNITQILDNTINDFQNDINKNKSSDEVNKIVRDINIIDTMMSVNKFKKTKLKRLFLEREKLVKKLEELRC